jgi:hypothetical protein
VVTRYGLRRGREWVALPARRKPLSQPPPLTDGEATWLPGLVFSTDPAEAWATGNLEVARERCVMLRHLGSISAHVQALP